MKYVHTVVKMAIAAWLGYIMISNCNNHTIVLIALMWPLIAAFMEIRMLWRTLNIYRSFRKRDETLIRALEVSSHLKNLIIIEALTELNRRRDNETAHHIGWH